MLGNARTAVKFLVYGLVIGLFFAPRSGKETRREVLAWVQEMVKDVTNTVTGNAPSSPDHSTEPLDG